jgi:hypothetical protein
MDFIKFNNMFFFNKNRKSKNQVHLRNKKEQKSYPTKPANRGNPSYLNSQIGSLTP